MNNKRKFFINHALISLIASALLSFFAAHAQLPFVGPLTYVHSINHHVEIVQDTNHTQFIVKRHDSYEKAIAEVLSAHIGASIGLNINQVECIDTDNYPHNNPEIIRTLHTIVPGEEVYQQSIGNSISIQGGLNNPAGFKSLTSFKKLSPIVALDIFTNNHDRHNGNLFFDALSQQFYAIDMDYAFCTLTCKPITFLSDLDHSVSFNIHTFLKEFQAQGKKLSSKKIDVLKEIKVILEKMLAAYPPKKLYDEWMRLASQIKRVYTREEKIKIATTLTQQYYLIKFLHAELTILTTKEGSAYTSKAIVSTGETIMAIPQKWQEFKQLCLEKSAPIMAFLNKINEKLKYCKRKYLF